MNRNFVYMILVSHTNIKAPISICDKIKLFFQNYYVEILILSHTIYHILLEAIAMKQDTNGIYLLNKMA